jgi:hypothetical protein
MEVFQGYCRRLSCSMGVYAQGVSVAPFAGVSVGYEIRCTTREFIHCTVIVEMFESNSGRQRAQQPVIASRKDLVQLTGF